MNSILATAERGNLRMLSVEHDDDDENDDDDEQKPYVSNPNPALQ